MEFNKFQKLYEINKKEREKRKAKIPKGLKIQKRKFLCAIGKAEPSPTEEEDEKFIQECVTPDSDDFFHLVSSQHRSLHWNDKIANNSVETILKEHQNFKLSVYLDCAKAIFLTYSGKIQQTEKIYSAFSYVIMHARLFGDPTKNMFQLENEGSIQIQFGDLSNPLSDSVYMKKITNLIKDLHTSYDEEKYMILNTNVTYITLLILRRFVKNETQFFDAFKRMNTHDDYVKLCPYPLNSQLPRIAEAFKKSIFGKKFKIPVLLAIHAFLNVNDDITKRVLRVTCVQHIEWTGLQVPFLFFKVARLYGVEEAQLWDLLQLQSTYLSLFRLADDYYKQYKMSKSDPPETVAWFPFCRALDGDYHINLSASQNKNICMIMAYLVDLKIGFNNSFTRNSHWAKEWGLEHLLNAAKTVQKQLNVLVKKRQANN